MEVLVFGAGLIGLALFAVLVVQGLRFFNSVDKVTGRSFARRESTYLIKANDALVAQNQIMRDALEQIYANRYNRDAGSADIAKSALDKVS